MDETGVLGLLEELSILLEDAKPVFGKNNLRQVDIAAAFEIMDDIRDTFPTEFQQARQIVRERQSLLDDAEAEANRMIEDARSQAMTIASEGVLDLQLEGIKMSLEPSPVSLHGLTHRELGDWTNTYALLMETGNPVQGRLRGYTDEDLIMTGEDPCYAIAYDLNLLYVDYSAGNFPMELRVGRHLAGISAYINAFNNNSDKQILVSGIPSYDEMVNGNVGDYLL